MKTAVEPQKTAIRVFGHVMRKEGLENLMVTGKIEGKRLGGGRNQRSFKMWQSELESQ